MDEHNTDRRQPGFLLSTRVKQRFRARALTLEIPPSVLRIARNDELGRVTEALMCWFAGLDDDRAMEVLREAGPALTQFLAKEPAAVTAPGPAAANPTKTRTPPRRRRKSAS